VPAGHDFVKKLPVRHVVISLTNIMAMTMGAPQKKILYIP